MLPIGKTVSLEVLRTVPMGLILGDASHEVDDEVLLPGRYVPESTSTGDILEVFLYTDSEDRPIATTERPFVEADQFACLRVVSATSTGVFLDWGLEKDLLLPFRSQLGRSRPEDFVVVRVLTDAISGRPVATQQVERFMEQPPEDLRQGQPVEVLIYEETELGYKAIVDSRFGGLLYHDPAQSEIEIGASGTGYVQQIRPDGKINLTLSPTGRAGLDDARAILLDALVEAGGHLDLHDRSQPEEIQRILGLSKKAFKRAVGGLYRERSLRINESSIELIESAEKLSAPTSEKDPLRELEMKTETGQGSESP